jgi:hypothetical protein
MTTIPNNLSLFDLARAAMAQACQLAEVKAERFTAALPECKPFKGQKLYVCRSEFQRLTGYPYNAKTEIAHLLGFKSASAIAELFEKDDRPYLTAYAHHLAEQLGEAVLWHPIKKTA